MHTTQGHAHCCMRCKTQAERGGAAEHGRCERSAAAGMVAAEGQAAKPQPEATRDMLSLRSTEQRIPRAGALVLVLVDC